MRKALFSLIALGLILALMLGFAGFLHPAFDTMAHFRWHIALGMIALALGGVVLKVRRVPLILIFFAALGVWGSGANNRLGALAPASADGVTGQKLTLLHYNLRFDNPQKDQVVAMIEKTDPDLVSLNETSGEWMPKLDLLKTRYPYSFHCPEWQAIGGSMLFSKMPLRNDKNYCHNYAALGLTEVQLGGQWIEIGVVHMRWPWPASGPAQLAAISPRLKTIGANSIIAGDFNAATWSHAVQSFAASAGTKVAQGFGGTWIYDVFPTSLAPFFGLPIDNAMAKGSVRITSVKSLPSIGSDHLPLLVEFTN